MAKYVSNKFKDLQVGLSDYSESKTSLEVVGAAVIAGVNTISSDGISITGVITASSFSGGNLIDGSATGIIGDDIITRNLEVSGLSTFTDNVDVNKNLDVSGYLDVLGNAGIGSLYVTGITTLGNVKFIEDGTAGIVTAVSGIVTYYGDGQNLTGVATAIDGNVISSRLYVSGISTFKDTIEADGDLDVDGHTELDDVNVGGAFTATTIVGTSLSVTGISTIGHLEVSGSGIVTAKAGAAVTYYGDGSKLTGIDATSLKDDNKTVKIQANSDGVEVTGILTTSNLEVSGDASVGSAITMTGSTGSIDATNVTAVNFVGDGSLLTNIHISEWEIGANASSDYVFSGPGLNGSVFNPTIYVERGQKYRFKNVTTGHPFRIQSDENGTAGGTSYDVGITNNDAEGGTESNILVWDVQFNAPDILYYQCTQHDAMGGKIYVGNSGDSISISTAFITTLNTGIVTATSPSGIVTYYGDGQHLTGVATALNGNAVATRLYVSGISTFNNNLEVSGIITAQAGAAITYYGDGQHLKNINADTLGDLDKLKVTGISTFAGITTVTGNTLFAETVSVSGVTTLGKGASGSVEIYDTNNLKLKTTGLGISIASGTAKTAHIEGPEEIWIDPSPVGVGTTSGVVRIKGDLYVDGTNFIVDSETITLGDHKVGIASTVADNALLDGGGIGIGSDNIEKTLTWNNASTSLKSSENFDLANTKSYNINGTEVLNATTLGSGVLNSSLTSVGTLDSLDVSGIATVSNTLHVGTGITASAGIISATKFYGSGEHLTGINADTIGSLSNIDVSGISTLGNVKFETAGIVTAVSGIVTYYGDGHHLTGVATALNGNALATRLRVSGVSTFLGEVGVNTTDPRFDQENVISGIKVNDAKLGVEGSIVIGNLSETSTDLRELAFYRRGGTAAGSPIDDHKMGRIAWYGSSNDTDIPDKAYSIDCVPDGGGWTNSANRKGYLSFNNHDSEVLRITSAGNVGLGTTNPSANFRVTIKSSTSPHSALLLDTTESDHNTNLYFANQATNKWVIGNKANDDSFRILSKHNETDTQVLGISSDGSLIVGGTSFGADGTFSVGANGTFRNILASGTDQTTMLCGIGGVSNGFTIKTNASDEQEYTFHNGSQQSVVITKDGNIGIGTSIPDDPVTSANTKKLAVGIVTANKLYVNGNEVSSGIGTWTAVAGIAHTINEYTIATNDFKTAEYIVYIGIGTKIQSQKLLVMQDGFNAYSQEYGVMYSTDLLVSIGSTLESGVVKIHATPDTGISGLTTYKFSRQTLL